MRNQAQKIPSLRLGAILVNIHRLPSITAKMLSTLDIISNGRIEFGLSAGWYENEISGMAKGTAGAAETGNEYEQGAAGANK
jgi:alkanesulfonate monooxygenase SsuD/methylene tetrahydromethanopterin reductase-like flavin-dependent oxidoreductase (luciferase family)